MMTCLRGLDTFSLVRFTFSIYLERPLECTRTFNLDQVLPLPLTEQLALAASASTYFPFGTFIHLQLTIQFFSPSAHSVYPHL
eukprot:6188290-Pleurochrysis_carterae.AAC.7